MGQRLWVTGGFMATLEGSQETAPAAGDHLHSKEQPACSNTVEAQPVPYPTHPIAQLQGPFEESILEVNDRSVIECVVDIDAQTRRRDLLENDEYERLCGRKWRQRASER